MNESEITTLAREYAELTDGSPADKSYITAIAENTIRFLLRRYVLVEKSKATGLCRLTLEHGDSVDYGLIDGLTDIVCELFSEQYEQEASNPENRKGGGGMKKPLKSLPKA